MPLAGAAVIWRLDWGRSVCFQAHTLGCWQKASLISLPCEPLHKTELLEARPMAFPKAKRLRERISDMWDIRGVSKQPRVKTQCFYNLISAVTQHHLSPRLLVAQIKSGTAREGATQRCESQEAGRLWGLLKANCHTYSLCLSTHL